MPYVPALDGLRALAILLVVLFHCKLPVLVGGNVGVDLFLVLSGFLITTLLLDELVRNGHIDTRSFYFRRLLRLMPPLVLLLVLYAVAAPWLWPDYPFHGRDVLALFLYMGNIAAALGSAPEKLLHGWSLGLEEQFYLAWPLLLTGLWCACCRRYLWQWLLLLYVMLTSWRLLSVFSFGVPHEVAYYRPDLHAGGLVLGAALAAWIFPQRAAWEAPAWVMPFALLLLLVVAIFPREGVVHLTFFVPLAEFATVLIILSVMARRCAPLQHPIVVQCGRLSYGVYLFHYPIMKFMTEQSMPWYLTLLLGGSFAYALAWLSYNTVERYARQYRGRHFSRN